MSNASLDKTKGSCVVHYNIPFAPGWGADWFPTLEKAREYRDKLVNVRVATDVGIFIEIE